MTYFNPRSYALIIKDNQLLVSTEFYENTGKTFTKLPGGGLEIGEGPAEALERELQEELNIITSITEIYAVNPKASKSVFDDSTVISFYWKVDFWKGHIETAKKINHDIELGWQELNWVNLAQLDVSEFSFLADQVVITKLLIECK